MRSTPLVEFRGIVLDPAKHGCLIDGDASCPQKFFDITIAQGIAEVPTHRAEDDVDFKVAPYAQRRIAHGIAPVIWDRDCLARCSRSPAIPATEPLTMPLALLYLTEGQKSSSDRPVRRVHCGCLQSYSAGHGRTLRLGSDEGRGVSLQLRGTMLLKPYRALAGQSWGATRGMTLPASGA